MRVLFCVNWKVDQSCTPAQAKDRFSPDYKIPGQPYWFFRHLDPRIEVDIFDSRVPFGTDDIERKYTKFLISQGVATYWKSKRYDLVVSHGGQSAMSFALLQKLFRNKPVPHLLFDIARITGMSNSSLIKKGCRYALDSLSATITHSSPQLSYYKDNFPNIAQHAHFVPLGVDLEEFMPLETAVEDQILCIGYAKRDWQSLISAYERLKTGTKLILLGVQSLPVELPKGVVCIPKVRIAEMREWISRSRFVVLPLPKLPYCIGQQTLLQTMALRKTVLAADIDATRDYITHGQNGFTYRAENVDDLEEKLQYMLSSQANVDVVSGQAYEYAKTHFSEELMAKRIYEICERIANA